MRFCVGIDEEHAAGLQAAFLANVFGGDVDDAGFGGEDDEVVLGDDVAAGAQAVAVERGADDAAVGKGDGGGAVPGFHEGGVVLVEGALVLVHVGIAGPGFGDEHGHDVGKGAAGLVEEFDGVVEGGGVAAAGNDDGKEIFDLVAVKRMADDGLARVHPAHVAADGVDFAVVGDVAVRVGELPAGEGVGGEALVDKRERAGDEGIGQLEVKLFNLGREHQALVDDGAAGERRNVEVLLALDLGVGDFVFSSGGGCGRGGARRLPRPGLRGGATKSCSM